MNVLLSIIIPVYNLEQYIRITLDSLIKEMSDDVEIIVVNDGSLDNSEFAVNEYIDSHTNYNIHLCTKKNGGVSSARNIGTDKSNGEYVLYLDGDDYLSEGSLKAIVNSLKINKPDILFWPYRTVNEQGDVVNSSAFKIDFDYQENGCLALQRLLCMREFYLVIGNAAYRREVITRNNVRFTEDCVAGEDMEFTWKSLALAKEVRFLSTALLNYVQREGSTIHRYNIQRFDSIGAIDRVRSFVSNIDDVFQNEEFEFVWDKELLTNYAGTYRMSLEQKMNEQSTTPLQACRIIDKDIDIHYHELRTLMYELFKKNRQKLKYSRLMIFFMISPTAYMFLNKIKGKTLQAFGKFSVITKKMLSGKRV